jgi:hypothetical protein
VRGRVRARVCSFLFLVRLHERTWTFSCARVWVCVCAMNTSDAWHSGYKKLLCESPRWKPPVSNSGTRISVAGDDFCLFLFFDINMIITQHLSYRFWYSSVLPNIKIRWSFWDIRDVWEALFDVPQLLLKPTCAELVCTYPHVPCHKSRTCRTYLPHRRSQRRTGRGNCREMTISMLCSCCLTMFFDDVWPCVLMIVDHGVGWFLKRKL